MARTIPNHYAAVAASVNQGIPVVKLAKHSPVSKNLMEWANKISGKKTTSFSHWMRQVLH